jgi:xylan 1,4-beta-xylosidase
MAWHYHDDDVPGPEAAVDLVLSGLPLAQGQARLTHYRIDEDHSNAYARWKRQGSPIAPTAEQYAELLAAAQLATVEGPATVSVDKGAATLRFALPRQAVSLLVLEW